MVRSLDNVPRMIAKMASPKGFGYRPVRNLTHMIEYQVYGLSTWGYHLTNLVLHALACFLLFLLARRMGLGPWASLAGMMVFAVHPLHTEAVTYISGRRDVLYSLFFVAGMLCYVAGVQQKKWWLPVLALGMYALSIFSKEMGITLPAVLYLWEVLVNRRGEGWARRLWLPVREQPLFWGIIWAGALGFFLFRGVILPRTFQPTWWGGDPAVNFATVAAVHLRYLAVQVLPVDLLADYSKEAFPLATGPGDPRALAGALVVLMTFGVAAGTLRRHPLVAFSLMAYWVLLLPVSHVIPHHELAAEHHLYLPSAFLCFALGVGCVHLGRLRAWAGPAACAALCVPLVALTIARNEVWRTEETLWTSVLVEHLWCARAGLNLGAYYLDRHEWERATPLLEQSVQVVDNCKTRAYLAVCYSRTGRLDEAHALNVVSFEHCEDEKHVMMAHALNLRMMGREAEAREVLDEARGFEDDHPDVHVITINVDRDTADARRFLQSVQSDLPVGLDNDAAVASQYLVTSMPQSVVIDRNGTVKLVKLGYGTKVGLTEIDNAVRGL